MKSYHVTLAFPLPPGPSAFLLQKILASGVGGVLWELREKEGMAYEVYTERFFYPGAARWWYTWR